MFAPPRLQGRVPSDFQGRRTRLHDMQQGLGGGLGSRPNSARHDRPSDDLLFASTLRGPAEEILAGPSPEASDS